MRYSLLTVTLALAFGAACGPRNKAEYGKKAPVVYRQVVSLSPSATEIAASVYSRIILGRTSDCDRPGNVKGVQVVLMDGSLDIDKIRASKPDCIVFDQAEVSAEITDSIQGLGIPIFVFGADTVAGHVEQVYEFGRFSEAERLGSRYADKVLRERDIALANASKDPVRVAFVRNDYDKGLQVAGLESFLADVVRTAGASPVGPPGIGWQPLDAAALVRKNPEVMIVSGTVGVFGVDPRFQPIQAVRTGRVVGMDRHIVERRGDRVDNLIKSVAELAKQVR